MIHTIKLLLVALLLFGDGTALFGQANPNAKKVTAVWPTIKSPQGTWNRIRTDDKSHNTMDTYETEFVNQSSSYFTGVFRGTKFTLHYRVRKPGAYGSGTLILSSHGIEQAITDINAEWNLTWAGDADNDGKLDLIIIFPSDGGGSNGYLFLSSHAGKEELVKLAATYIDEGC